MITYANNKENSLIFSNHFYSNLFEKILKQKQELINPFVALRDWLQEEILEVEAMQLAIKKIHNLLETEEKLKSKLNKLEEEKQGQFNFIKSILKNK